MLSKFSGWPTTRMTGRSPGRFDPWRRSTTPVRSRFARRGRFLRRFVHEIEISPNPSPLLHTSPDLLTDKNIGNEQEATETFMRINDAYQRLTAEPEDVELFTEYDEYEFDHLGPDFFFAFEGGNRNAAAEFFRRFWDDLRSYSDDEFVRTYHDYTHYEGQRGRKGRRGAPKAEPGVRGRRKSAKAPADKKKAAAAEKKRDPPLATEDDARRARAFILSTLHSRPAMLRRDTREVTLRVTKSGAFPSFPQAIDIERLFEHGDFARKFEVEVRKESDGPFRRASEASGEDRDGKKKYAASGTREAFSRREVFDASGPASGTVTVRGLEPGVRYRFRTRLGCGSENDVTWSEPGVESVYAAKRAPEEKKSAAAKPSSTPPQNASSESSREPRVPTSSKRGSKDSESPYASPSSSVSDSAFAKKKRAAPLSSRETALAAVAAAEAAERAAAAAKAEKKRADRLASMSSGERAAEAAREEAEAARSRAEAEKQRLKAEARKEKKRLAAARAAEREREERANAAEREREWAELYRAQFAAETAERDAQVTTLLSDPTREQARAARAAAFAAAAAEEDARAAAALKAAKSAEWVSEEKKAALREDECAAAARISAALAAADEAAKGTRFETWDASVGIPIPSSTSAARSEAAPEIECPPVEALDTTTFVAAPAVSASPSTAKPCRFWSGTGCKFGDACRFAHDGAGRTFAAPPEAPVPATEPPALGTSPGSSKAALSSSHVKRRAKAYKTKPCRYWTQKGTCKRGDACGFIHGDAPEHPGGTQTQPATRTARFASHSDTFCGVCRLPFDSEHELVEHLWSDAHRDRISDAFETHEGE